MLIDKCNCFLEICTITMHILFLSAASNWSTSSTVSSAPLKAEVRGTKSFANGTVYNMHHIYDYFNYRPGSDGIDDTVFQVNSPMLHI